MKQLIAYPKSASKNMHITKLTQAYYFNSSVLVAKSVLFFPVLQYICLQFIQRTDAIQQCVYFAFNE